MPKAVLCRSLGGPDSLALEAVESRPLTPGEVRVAIHAAGVNFPDLLMTEGRYQHKPPLPFVPGLEAAGIVAEVTEEVAAGLAVGDRVIVSLRQGGYAEEAIVAPEQLIPLPNALRLAPIALGLRFLGALCFRTAISRSLVFRR